MLNSSFDGFFPGLRVRSSSAIPIEYLHSSHHIPPMFLLKSGVCSRETRYYRRLRREVGNIGMRSVSKSVYPYFSKLLHKF